MKVLIITNSFYESTFPLVKKLKENVEVSLLCVQNNNNLTPPEFDCSFLKHHEFGFHNAKDFTNDIQKNVLNYFDGEISFIKILYSKSFFFSVIETLKYISLTKPDIIHFMGVNPTFSVISRFINKKVYFSIHEFSMNRLLNSKSLASIFKSIKNTFSEYNVYSNKNNNFIFHSYNQLNQYKSKYNSKNTILINFGVFETFKFHDLNEFKLPFSEYLIFVGKPHYYKGLDLLIDYISTNNLDINIVVAGSGTSKFNICNDKGNFYFVDKFLEGKELYSLIEKSNGVILPYRSASQSGLPSLCMAINTPVITTDIPGILEYLEPDWNSIIIDFSESSVKNILFNQKALNKKLKELKSNIKIEPYKSKKFDWTIIAKTTLEFYEN